MDIERVKHLLKKKESMHLEFKEARNDLPKNLFESITSMLNRDGGDIILGISDNGGIRGVEEAAVFKMMTDLTNLSNDMQKVDPPFILFPQRYKIDDKSIIHIQVPASSQVHKTGGFIFDRSEDGDFRVTHAHQIAELHNRKRNYYTEGIIYPALKFEDFKQELFSKVRNLIRSYNLNHPWLALDDKEMLKIAGLWKKDFQTGGEGYTLAAILLFGRDEIIQQVIPHYKVDAMVRIDSIERYDDRAYIQTNLIEAYETLMDFVAKHLSDKFYMEGDQRVSLRTKIFREVIANLLVHREYTNAYPCKFTIFADRVETENANNNPRIWGKIDPANFIPFPKNPTIAKFFIQLGRVDELGSGVLNVSKFVKDYASGGEASFIDGDIFRMIIPRNKLIKINDGVNDGVNDGANDGANMLVNDAVSNAVKRDAIGTQSDAVVAVLIEIFKVISEYQEGISFRDISLRVEKSQRTIERYLKILRKSNLIEFRGASKTGRYFLTQNADKRNED